MKKLFIPIITALVLALSCEKASQEGAVSSVSLDRTTAEMTIGETLQLSASITPSNMTDLSISWTSSKQSVATVTDQGLVKALAEGRTTIKANVGGKMAACIVTVKKEVIAVTSVSLDKNSISLAKGESETLVATVTPANATNKKVTWTSSAPSVASVDSDGKVNAIASGNATITAKAGDMQATCAVTVTIPVQSISLNISKLTLIKGQSETLVATIDPADATVGTPTWSSSNTNIASVENGKVTAVGGGNATITVKAGEKVAACQLTVIVPIETIVLNQQSLTLGEGDSFALKATLTPKDASDKTITWSSSDESVASVDQGGVISAIRQGTATITAKAGDKEATCVVTVIKRVSSISLDKMSLTLLVGNTDTLTPTVLPEDATDKTVTWASYNTSVATVDNGVVKGIGIGATTIKAFAGNASVSCPVWVLLDSATGVYARFTGGNYEMIDDVVQPGGSLKYEIRNYSTEAIHVVSAQLIDGQTGAATEAMSIDSDILSTASNSWSIPVGASGIHSPKVRFTYTFKGESYSCEAEITPL